MPKPATIFQRTCFDHPAQCSTSDRFIHPGTIQEGDTLVIRACPFGFLMDWLLFFPGFDRWMAISAENALKNGCYFWIIRFNVVFH